MSELATLARPYAEAVFKRAVESNAAAKWSDTLSFLAVVTADKDVAALMRNPKVDKQSLTRLLLDICAGQVDNEGENLVKLLVDNGRLPLVPFIRDLYEQHRAEKEGYVDVEVRTAYSMTKEEQKQLTKTLQKTLNKKPHLKIVVDASLLGGFIARAGDKVIDGSVKGQLQQLAKRL
jgi:F-type H+-transporting ATPase subunit delta